MIQHISALQDIGKDKYCLIIGGGLSVRKLDIHLVPFHFDIICINNHFNDIADTIIYYDKDMKEHFDNVGIIGSQRLIGFRNNGCDNTSKHCTHFYTAKDHTYGDTGFSALQFADRVFNYYHIFLIGYDYTVDKNTHHENEESTKYVKEDSDKTCYDRFVIHSIGKVLPMYDTLEIKNKVYNCNPDSAIKRFEYRTDYLTT